MSAALALIAHDLKNALGALESELAALAQAPGAEPRHAEAAHSAHLHCTDLRQQFVQFLTLYGAESGGLRALCEDESPLDLLRALQSAWQLKLARQSQPTEVRLHAPQAPAFWHFDRRLVQLALDAALHNATRFARSWVELSVRVHTDAQAQAWLVWRITDDGPGLEADDPHATSTGLGTSLCAAVAKVHSLGQRQGHIQLAAALPHGTTFELSLP